jgi:RimJ/RimL family protein N-acetyltransferase
MQQKPLVEERLTGYQVELRQIVEQDLELLRQWRNDPSVAQFMLSQQHISEEQQRLWFKHICQDQSQAHYLVLYKSEPIGSANIRCYFEGEDLAKASTIEPGIYIAKEQYRNNLLAFAPTLVLNDYCFEHLKVERLKAVVKADNQAALSYNKKLGYKVDSATELVEISLTREDYEQDAKMLKSFLSRPTTT